MNTSKFSNCSICPLVNQGRCIGDTNCREDITKVEVLVLGGFPLTGDIEAKKPISTHSGIVFRTVFDRIGLSKHPYMISNVVLCDTLDKEGKQIVTEPMSNVVNICRGNWEALVSMTKPNIILAMGKTALEALGLNPHNLSIENFRGQVYKFKNVPVLVTIDPASILLHPDGLESPDGEHFIADLMYVRDFLRPESPTLNSWMTPREQEDLVAKGPVDSPDRLYKSPDECIDDMATESTDDYYYKDSMKGDSKIIGAQSTPYSHSLPTWCYGDDVALFDVQYMYADKSIAYTFKTANGKKYHKVDGSENYYYIGSEPEIGDAPMLNSIDKVNLVLGPSPQDPDGATYESDVKPEIKRAIDYRYNRKTDEPDIPLLKMYADIEVYNHGSRRFPDPKKAESPINAISFKIADGPVNVWICRLPQMDQKPVEIPEGVLYKSYSSEYNLLQAFAKLVSATNPDILAGWNFLGFDMVTIYGRMTKLGVDPNLMSPLGLTYIDLKRYGRVFVYGIHVMDMLDLYKELTYSVEESYKLDFVAEKQLGTGKVSYTGTLDQLYETNISEFIRYSAVDTDLLFKLDAKMGHIDLKYELIRICATTWKAGETTMGLVDPLCISYAKEQNLVCRNAVIKAAGDSIPGAYVRHPVKGRHNYVIDLDFASLYPSIICSCNIGPNTFVAKIDPAIAHKIIYCRERLDPDMEIDIILGPLRANSSKRKTKISQLLKTIDTKKSIVTAAGTIFKGHEEDISFLNKILTYLLDSRKQYKNSMKDAKRGGEDSKFKRFGNMQLSYKILANSIYGVLANHAFRFFNNDMAMSITLTGQEIVKFSGHHLGQYMKTGKTTINPDFLVGYEEAHIPYVLYQDTDSIFVSLGDYLVDHGLI